MIYSIMVMTLKEDQVAAVAEAARVLAPATREEKGCVSYILLQPEGTTDTVIFAEAWETPEDFAAHVAAGGVEGTPLNIFSKVIDPAVVAPPQHWVSSVLA